MAVKLVYHDLIQAWNAICWLRLYEGEGDAHVAVVTEVPGNPGSNAMNGLEAIADYLQEALNVNSATLTFFQVWPSGFTDAAPEISRVTLGSDPHWTKIGRREIVDLVGELPLLPEHGELLKRAAALGGWERYPIMRDVFRAVPVSELPAPHRPFNCAHAERHTRILTDLESRGGDNDGTGRERRAGQLFIQTLTPSDLAACRYHHANWRAIAHESVAILRELGVRDERSDYQEAARKRLRGEERGLLESLFRDPILIGGGGYTNGQHRGCALRFSGAAKAAVVVDKEETGMFEYPWTYQGDG